MTVGEAQTTYQKYKDRIITYSKIWRDKNKEKLSIRSKKWYSENKEHCSERKKAWKLVNQDSIKEKDRIYRAANVNKSTKKKKDLIESSLEHFLKNSMLSTLRYDRKIKRLNDLDFLFLQELLEFQGRKCAITGIKLAHKFGDLRTISIDRIDNGIGHIKGNVQLVCQFVNIGKNNKPDSQVREIIREIELNMLRRLKARGYLQLPSDRK